MSYHTKQDIYSALAPLHKMLKEHNCTINLLIVGGAALSFNGIESIGTCDIDTLTEISQEVKDYVDDLGIDLNNDVWTYRHYFDDVDFIYDDENPLSSNINISYLSLSGVILTKMGHSDPDKLAAVAWILKEELGVNLDEESICDWLSSNGVDVDGDVEESVSSFLDQIDESDLEWIEFD